MLAGCRGARRQTSPAHTTAPPPHRAVPLAHTRMCLPTRCAPSLHTWNTIAQWGGAYGATSKDSLWRVRQPEMGSLHAPNRKRRGCRKCHKAVSRDVHACPAANLPNPLSNTESATPEQCARAGANHHAARKPPVTAPARAPRTLSHLAARHSIYENFLDARSTVYLSGTPMRWSVPSFSDLIASSLRRSLSILAR